MPATNPAPADPIALLISDHGEHDHPTLRTPDSARAYLLALAGNFGAPRTPAFTADELEMSDPES